MPPPLLVDDLDATTTMAGVIDIAIRMWPDVDSKVSTAAAHHFVEGNVTTGAYIAIMDATQHLEDNRAKARVTA